ncbi:MAG: carbohydrate binding family 9 domain-containing protein [Acidobacteriia bacterium]|nr:carbohydrate binding family 9 domain-containing protein [Terriglobia bacterium]
MNKVRKMTSVVVLWILPVVAGSTLLNAQVELPREGAQVAIAVRAAHPPRLDGTLDDPIWGTAPTVDDFRQREPIETRLASEKTEVHILYDARHVYFGIHCYDDDTKGIVATQLRRDISQDLDDNFAVVIDPTLSHRNGYVFQVNPLGTQRDGEIVEEQSPPQTDSIVDPSWDGLWISAAKITNDGWTATIEIPFSTLNFRGATEVTWGVNFRRFIRRKNEEDEWSGFRRVFGFWRVSQAGVLQGLSGIESGRLLVVKPYGLLGVREFSRQPWSALHTGGVDVKYGLASNLIAVGTVNTDFSDADVDQQQFNLTPYPVLIPEKRRFFLEDSDIFDFLLWNQDLLFFTRQIGIDPVSGQEVPIDAGGKIAGHAAGLDLGVMDVRTRAEGPNPYGNYAVMRVKRPLMPGSYVGFMATDQESGNPLNPYDRSGGLDAKFVLFGNLNLRGYYAKSWSPGLNGDNAAFGGRLTYANNWFNIYAGHGVTERNFNAEMGFVTRTDDQPTIFQFNFTPRPHVLNIRELDLGGFVSYDPDTADKLIYRESTANIRVLFNNSAEIDSSPADVVYQYLSQPLHLYKNISIPAGSYRFDSHQLAYTSAGNRRLTFTPSFQWGGYYTGTLKTAGVTAQYRPNPHLALAINNTLNVFRLPQGNFNIELAGLQVSCAFNRFVSLTTFMQVDTAQTQAASANVRLRYTFHPDSDLYVIYNRGTRFQSLAAGNPLPVREQKFAVKVTYSWSK